MSSPTAYELYRSGVGLLEQGDHHAAALPLGRARDLEPTTGMVREALGRALFGSQRYREAAEEFGVLVELEPLNDFGQFCLGRALQLQGRHAEARPPLTMAALLKPDRADYRVYRDRTIAALDSGAGAAEPEADATPPGEHPAPGRRRSGEGPWGAPATPSAAAAAGTAGVAPDDAHPGTAGVAPDDAHPGTAGATPDDAHPGTADTAPDDQDGAAGDPDRG
jgi:tetratricopeptide (TPR) repeat protein